MLRLCCRLSVLFCLAASLAACALPPEGGGPGGGPGGRRSGGGLGRGPGGSLLPGDSDPARFKGLIATEITTALGDPNSRRREPPAEIWQYYGEGCILDLFLYDEKDGKTVSHAELRSRVPGQLPDADCLPKLLSGQRDKPSS
jgi:hypothetical protein